MNKLKKIIYVTTGCISLIMGLVGIIIPVLPTTPFLLLSSVCFFKGSEKLYQWFKSTKIYKNKLENFIKYKSMTLKQKTIILLTADLMIGTSIIIVKNIYIRMFLVGIILFKYYYFIFKIDTYKEDTKNINGDRLKLDRKINN